MLNISIMHSTILLAKKNKKQKTKSKIKKKNNFKISEKLGKFTTW